MRKNVYAKGKHKILQSGDQVTKNYYHYPSIKQAQNAIFRNLFTFSKEELLLIFSFLLLLMLFMCWIFTLLFLETQLNCLKVSAFKR